MSVHHPEVTSPDGLRSQNCQIGNPGVCRTPTHPDTIRSLLGSRNEVCVRDLKVTHHAHILLSGTRVPSSGGRSSSPPPQRMLRECLIPYPRTQRGTLPSSPHPLSHTASPGLAPHLCFSPWPSTSSPSFLSLFLSSPSMLGVYFQNLRILPKPLTFTLWN